MPLFVVSTPIGNLDDLSPRAARALRDAAVVACEDTRQTAKLLAHLGVRTPLVRYDDHVHRREAPRLLERLSRGEAVALVTDAGTPGVSDPGASLVRAALAAGAAVTPVPGPSAPLALLAASGLPMDRFVFLGFLPRRAARQRRAFEAAGALGTVVFLESVHRLADTLTEARAVYGDVPAVVGREMTKLHEEFLRGTIGELLALLAERQDLKGEAAVAVAPQLIDGVNSES